VYIDRLGEHGLIRRIQNRFRVEDRSVILGIGDDAAVISPPPGKFLLLSTDTLREGVHFRRKYSTFYDIGWKAVAVSISDIAAMGGTPRHLLLSVAMPQKTSVRGLDQLFKGVEDITARYGVSLIGGNVSRSRGGLTVDTTLIGELIKGEEVLRSGASVSDLIYVTGTVGNSAIGLSILESFYDTLPKSPSPGIKSFILNHLRPEPRVREGVTLGTRRLATAMIDISDGLLADLWHICEQSHVGACIYSNLIPLPKVPAGVARKVDKDPLSYALYGGEDYELIFTVKRKDKKRLEGVCAQEKIDITLIGEILPKEKGIRLVGKDGQERVVEVRGFDHFMGGRGRRC